ncbi:MAG: CpaF family protein [Caldiserica bacterium]|nr:CpaF family protein [Caldisericota bacterium]
MDKKLVTLGGFAVVKDAPDVRGARQSISKLAAEVREQLFRRYSADAILSDINAKGRRYVYAQCADIIAKIVSESKIDLTGYSQQDVVASIVSEITGFGPIDPLLSAPDITEIMVNGPDQVFIEQKGRIVKSDIRFENVEQLRRVIDKIVQPLGRRIDESSPYVDARLPDGSRVNVIIPPIALQPTVTIRRFRHDVMDRGDFTRLGSLDDATVDFLSLLVKSRLNVIVSGGTGTGKTTFLNFLSGMIESSERILTIEDSRELTLKQPHVVALEARPANIEGKGEVSIRDLVKNALRMRPDRIVVGEVRGAEAFDMLQAMNTGHDGSMTTVHANSPDDVLPRLMSMVLMTGARLPEKTIGVMIASALDIVIHLYHFEDGSRKVGSIGEYVLDDTTQFGVRYVPLLEFVRASGQATTKVDGSFVMSQLSVVPRCYTKMKLHGVQYAPFEALAGAEHA